MREALSFILSNWLKKIVPTCLFCLFSILSFAQHGEFSLKANELPLEAALKEIESKYKFLFSYEETLIKDVFISVDIAEKDIESFLFELLAKTSLEFNLLQNNYVVLFQAKEERFQNQRICGTVIDLLTNEPLAFANVMAKTNKIGTETNDEGRFELKLLENAKDSILISYVGYEKKSISLTDFIQGNCIDIYLNVIDIGEAYVVVTDYLHDGVKLEENGLSTTLKPKQIGSVPGLAEPDLLRSIQLLPGVSSPSSRVSDLYVRGGTPDQNLLTWEYIPVYHTGHYFGMISSINPFIIEEAKIYRSGFNVEYGGRLASVIDLKSSTTFKENTYLGMGSNMTHAFIYGRQKFQQNKRNYYTFSLRRSYTELFETPTIKNISKINQQGYLLGNREVESLPDHIRVEDEISFLDMNLKLDFELNESNHISISGLSAKNGFSDSIEDNRRNEIQSDSMDLNNKGLSIKYDSKINSTFDVQVKAAYAFYDYHYTYKLNNFNDDKPKNSGLKSNSIKDKQVQLQGTTSLKNNQALNFGYHLIAYDVGFQIDQLSNNVRDNINDEGESNGSVHALYASFKKPIKKGIGINAGIRVNYFDKLEAFYLEPRINLSYRLNEQISLHANYGLHHQFVAQFVEYRGNSVGIDLPIWNLAQGKSDPVQQSSIYQFGLVFNKNNWVLDLQFYRRSINGLSSRAFDFEMIEAGEVVIGNSKSKGFDFMIKKRFKNLHTWLSYTLSETVISLDQANINYFPSSNDQRHILQWSNQIKFGNFEVGLGLNIASGLPYSLVEDYRIVSSPNQAFMSEKIYDGINNYNLESTKELNISLAYKFKPTKKGMKTFIGFSIINVINEDNLYNRTFTIEPPMMNSQIEIRTIDKTRLKRTPNLSLRIEW